MADEDLVAKILADYPSFAFLINDPEIGPLLLEAVDPNKGFDAATFQAKLLQTSWWKTHSAAQRQWQVTLNTDPASAAQQREERYGAIRSLAGQLGLSLPDANLRQFAEQSLVYGIDSNSPTLRGWLSNLASQSPAFTATTSAALRTIANQDYLIPMADADLNRWAADIAGGYQTEDAFRATMQTLAKGRFAAFAPLIGEGVTPGQIFAPYRSAIAQELELGSADQVDILNDPKWAQITGVTGEGGQMRPMTMSEALKLARSQDAWKATSRGRELGAGLTQSLLRTFGETA